MVWKEFLDLERISKVYVGTNVKYGCCQRELDSHRSNIKLYLLGIWKSLMSWELLLKYINYRQLKGTTV